MNLGRRIHTLTAIACVTGAALIASLLPALPAQAHIGFCAPKRNTSGCSDLQVTITNLFEYGGDTYGAYFIGMKVHVELFGRDSKSTIKKGSLVASIVLEPSAAGFEQTSCGPNDCKLDGMAPAKLDGKTPGTKDFAFAFRSPLPAQSFSSDPMKGQYQIDVRANAVDKGGFHLHDADSYGFNINSRFTKDEQDSIGKESRIFKLLAASCGVAGLAFPELAPLVFACGAGAGVDSDIFSSIKTDPPDPDYTQPATLDTPPHDTIQPGGQLSQASADAANAYLDALYAGIGFLRAAETSGNRAGAAKQAGDTGAESDQVQALTSYMTQAANAYQQLIQLGIALRDSLINDGFQDVPIDHDQLVQEQNTLKSGGWPSDWPNSDFTDQEKAGAIDALTSSDFPDGDTSLYDALANGNDASGNHELETAMNVANNDAQSSPLTTGASLSIDPGSASDITSCVGSDATCTPGGSPAALNASDVAVTSDGHHALIAAPGTRSLLSYDLETSTGVLSPTENECAIDHTRFTSASGCTQSPTLADPESIALAPDDSDVYVANTSSSSIETFTRNTTTGALTELGCFTDPSVTITGCNKEAGLQQPSAIVASSDGKDVLVASRGSGTLVDFTRDPNTGALTYRDSTPAPGLDGVDRLAISSDGNFLAVGSSSFDGAIATFTRDKHGNLTSAGCWSGSNADCTSAGLEEVGALAFSANGKYLYQADFGGINTWAVNSDGTLQAPAELFGCTADPGFDEVYDPCINAVGDTDVTDLAVTPDGSDVYAVNEDGTITSFNRDTTNGALYQMGSCLTPDPSIDDRCTASALLGRSGHLAFASDGTQSYLITPGAIGASGIHDVVSALSLSTQPDPRLSINSVRRREGNGKRRPRAFVFTVTLNGVTDNDVSVDFTTVDGSAKAGKDYIASAGTLHLDAPPDIPQQGVRTATITVFVRGDRRKERNENFTVQLSNPVNAYIARDTGTGTILNDD